jgi:hypothetical protein
MPLPGNETPDCIFGRWSWSSFSFLLPCARPGQDPFVNLRLQDLESGLPLTQTDDGVIYGGDDLMALRPAVPFWSAISRAGLASDAGAGVKGDYWWWLVAAAWVRGVPVLS